MIFSYRWKMIFWLLVCFVNFLSCRAANQYCIFGSTVSIKIDDHYNRDEMIVPTTLDYIDDGLFKSCRWTADSLLTRSDYQIVLQGLPMKQVKVDSASLPKDDLKTPANLVVTFKEKKFKVEQGFTYVSSVKKVFPLTVEVNWDPRTQTASNVQLRIMLVLPGLCDTSMLSYKGSCYALTEMRNNLTAALARLGGDVQLASFDNMTELRNFIAANNARVNTHPYKQPLNLSQSVRLGMFYMYKEAAAALYSIAKTDGGSCGLQPMTTARELSLLGGESTKSRCVALRVEASDSVTVELDNCNVEKFLLFNFPETSSNGTTFEYCNIPTIVDVFMQQNASVVTTVPTVTSGPLNKTSTALTNARREYGSTNSLAVILGIIIPLIGIVVLIVIILKRKHQRGSINDGDDGLELGQLRPSDEDGNDQGGPGVEPENPNGNSLAAAGSNLSQSIISSEPQSLNNPLDPPSIFADKQDLLSPEEFMRLFPASQLQSIQETQESLERQPGSLPADDYQTCAMNPPRNLPPTRPVQQQDQTGSVAADPTEDSCLMASLGSNDFQTCQPVS